MHHTSTSKAFMQCTHWIVCAVIFVAVVSFVGCCCRRCCCFYKFVYYMQYIMYGLYAFLFNKFPSLRNRFRYLYLFILGIVNRMQSWLIAQQPVYIVQWGDEQERKREWERCYTTKSTQAEYKMCTFFSLLSVGSFLLSIACDTVFKSIKKIIIIIKNRRNTRRRRTTRQ